MPLNVDFATYDIDIFGYLSVPCSRVVSPIEIVRCMQIIDTS